MPSTSRDTGPQGSGARCWSHSPETPSSWRGVPARLHAALCPRAFTAPAPPLSQGPPPWGDTPTGLYKGERCAFYIAQVERTFHRAQEQAAKAEWAEGSSLRQKGFWASSGGSGRAQGSGVREGPATEAGGGARSVRWMHVGRSAPPPQQDERWVFWYLCGPQRPLPPPSVGGCPAT